MRQFMIVAAIATLLVDTRAAAQEPNPQVPTILTVGEATVRRAPDQAFISAAVETRARLPREAQKQNADMMAAVQQRIAESGISNDAVRTTGYSIQQEFDFTNGRRVARGYVARNGVEIHACVADLERDDIPLAPLLLVNAPPPVHERVAAALDSTVEHVIVSGIVSHEVQAVIDGYAGFEVAHGLGTEDEWIALRLKRS